jgi:hypothetical protein
MKERMALTLNWWVTDGINRCCIGFLPQPYVVQGKLWDGILCQVVKVVKKNDPNKTRRTKYHANKCSSIHAASWHT